MQSEAKSVQEYIDQLPEDRKEFFKELRNTILANLPQGFQEEMSYGMIGYVVPLSIYPAGYHSASNTPLPFASIASQKNHIALYHMGLYTSKELMNWFLEEYSLSGKLKLDMGKSCLRFKKPGQIPFKLIGKLMGKLSVYDWIQLYETTLKKRTG